MRGISAVIAVVLILMITVALAAAAYVWFNDIFETMTTGVSDAATKIVSEEVIAKEPCEPANDTIEIYGKIYGVSPGVCNLEIVGTDSVSTVIGFNCMNNLNVDYKVVNSISKNPISNVYLIGDTNGLYRSAIGYECGQMLNIAYFSKTIPVDNYVTIYGQITDHQIIDAYYYEDCSSETKSGNVTIKTLETCKINVKIDEPELIFECDKNIDDITECKIWNKNDFIIRIGFEVLADE